MGDSLNNIINPIITFLKRNYSHLYIDSILDEFKKLISEIVISPNDDSTFYDFDSLQKFLSDFNEKSSKRKDNGVYYTPSDLCDFINSNSIKLWLEKLNANEFDGFDFETLPYLKFCFKSTIFDPTCGSGEFLMSIVKYKLTFLKKRKENISTEDIKKVIETIFGNDIDHFSTFICKVRLFLLILDFINQNNIDFPYGISGILNNHFFNEDYIKGPINNLSFDLIVGNPPYIEDSKYKITCTNNVKYGNVYANVLFNSCENLNNEGVLGFVIPLSYMSTPRMKKIRNDLKSFLTEQYILSFNDRPDCLFTNVHQKLCVLICKKSCRKINRIYTSNYYYWYKEERPYLFDKANVILNNFSNENFIPKIGNAIENSIYEKVTLISSNSLLSFLSENKGNTLYLNSRAAFWIKAFRNDHNFQNSYLRFNCKSTKESVIVFSILNSSLFWWFWVVVSDCWHITNKELSAFKIPNISDSIYKKLIKASSNLEKKLEETKVFVGTKQTEYEYKHRECIKEIQIIDALIGEIYDLSKDESDFIKSYAFRYRVSGGNNR